MKTKTSIIIASIVLLIIATLYIIQGGMNNVEVKEITSQKRFIIGENFEGNISSKSFRDMFTLIKKLKENENLDGDLATIYYNNPEKSEGNIKAFFGVMSHHKPNQFEGYKILEIESEKYLQGRINASGAFVNKTYNAIFDYADEKKIILEERYLEWFPSGKEIIVQIKIKDE